MLRRPLDLGADVVVHSVTKFLAGHSDVVMGVAVTRDPALVGELTRRRSLRGAIPGPFETLLALRGVRTLAVRRPKHAGRLDEFIRDGLEPLLRAMVGQDEAEFRSRYAACVAMANRFHVETGHAYIEWTTPAASPERGLGLP